MPRNYIAGVNPGFQRMSESTPPPEGVKQSPPAERRLSKHEPSPASAQGFPGALLQRFLPKNFDDGDLLIFLILMLVMREQQEDPMTMIIAALTYFSSDTP